MCAWHRYKFAIQGRHLHTWRTIVPGATDQEVSPLIKKLVDGELADAVMHKAALLGSLDDIKKRLAKSSKEADKVIAVGTDTGPSGVSYGVSPLMLAARGNSVPCVELLLSKKANPRQRTPKGVTALSIAAEEVARDERNSPSLASVYSPSLVCDLAGV
jgi:hypothetical protein